MARSNSKQSSVHTKSLSSTALMAMKELDALESKLDLDIVVRPNDKNQMRAATRVSSSALRMAADIVGAAPDRFPEFIGIADDAAYVETMLPLANRALALANHIQKSIQNRQAPASEKTLALYAVVKGLGRIADNETMREKVELLKAEVAPHSRAKMTKAEKVVKLAAKRRAERILKAKQFLRDNGEAVPTSPAETPAAKAPQATPPKTIVAPAATPSPLAN